MLSGQRVHELADPWQATQAEMHWEQIEPEAKVPSGQVITHWVALNMRVPGGQILMQLPAERRSGGVQLPQTLGLPKQLVQPEVQGTQTPATEVV